jgi:hypothetical protein
MFYRTPQTSPSDTETQEQATTQRISPRPTRLRQNPAPTHHFQSEDFRNKRK